MIDMSKAFDNVNRLELLKDLRKILQDDELHMVKILITDVQLQVKNKDIIGEKFITTKGIPQGDSMSPLLFTLYLAKTLDSIEKNYDLKNVENEHNYSKS